MTPDKDPQNYSVLAYLAFGGLSVWGGLVTYIQTVKREGRQFRWAEALLQVPGQVAGGQAATQAGAGREQGGDGRTLVQGLGHQRLAQQVAHGLLGGV